MDLSWSDLNPANWGVNKDGPPGIKGGGKTPEHDLQAEQQKSIDAAAAAAADKKAAEDMAATPYGINPNVDVAKTAGGSQQFYDTMRAQYGQTRGAPRDVNAPDPTQVQYANGVNINTAQSDQTRAQQQGYISGLQNAVAGNGPSVAQAQYARGMADATANQFGQAAQGRGTSRAALMRGAAYNAAGIQQRGAFDTAALRANEQIAAQSQLGNALSGIRGQDMSLATNQAALTQGTELANAAAQNSAFMQDPRLSLQAGISNQGADVTTRAQDINDVNTQASLLVQQQGQAGALATARIGIANAKSKDERDYWTKVLASGVSLVSTGLGAYYTGSPGAGKKGGDAVNDSLGIGTNGNDDGLMAPTQSSLTVAPTPAPAAQPGQQQTIQPTQSAFAPPIDQSGYNQTPWYDPYKSQQDYLAQLSLQGQGRY